MAHEINITVFHSQLTHCSAWKKTMTAGNQCAVTHWVAQHVQVNRLLLRSAEAHLELTNSQYQSTKTWIVTMLGSTTRIVAIWMWVMKASVKHALLVAENRQTPKRESFMLLYKLTWYKTIKKLSCRIERNIAWTRTRTVELDDFSLYLTNCQLFAFNF